MEEYRYDAWGRVMGVYDGAGHARDESAIGNHHLFQGRWYSWQLHKAMGNSGLYFFRARWYDPVTGRWLSNDPIGISGGLNQYSFVANNPVNRRDPLGLCEQQKKREYREAVQEVIDQTRKRGYPEVADDLQNLLNSGAFVVAPDLVWEGKLGQVDPWRSDVIMVAPEGMSDPEGFGNTVIEEYVHHRQFQPTTVLVYSAARAAGFVRTTAENVGSFLGGQSWDNDQYYRCDPVEEVAKGLANKIFPIDADGQ